MTSPPPLPQLILFCAITPPIMLFFVRLISTGWPFVRKGDRDRAKSFQYMISLIYVYFMFGAMLVGNYLFPLLLTKYLQPILVAFGIVGVLTFVGAGMASKRFDLKI